MGDSPHPKEFITLGQPHFINEFSSTSKDEVNTEALLAGYSYFLTLSYSNYLFYVYSRVLTRDAMFGFKLQSEEGRQRAHST